MMVKKCFVPGCMNEAGQLCKCSSPEILLCEEHTGEHVNLPNRAHNLESIFMQPCEGTKEAILEFLAKEKSKFSELRRKIIDSFRQHLPNPEKGLGDFTKLDCYLDEINDLIAKFSQTSKLLKFDLDQNRWIKLTPMPKADYWCNSIIFNGNILISGHWNKNLWLYSIDIDSFSTIPYEFKYNERKILINAERLYLIECRGSIYESEIGSYSNWRRIAESKFNFNQVFCSYNKGGIYISNISILDEEYYYYFFNLDQKIIIDIAYYGRHAALRRVGKKIEVIKSNVQNFKLDSNYLDERSLKDNALKTLGEKFAKIEFYDKQITLDPDSATFYNKKCNAFYNWERYLEAIECFDEAIKPKDANYYNKKGHAFCNWERYLEAIECYDGAIKLDPKDASFYDNKGDAFYNLERYLEAIECFDEAIKLDPKNAIYYKNKGDAFYNLKRYREAIECFDEAVKLDPKNAIYYKNKGDAFYNLERYREAIKPKNLFFSKCIMI